jgi:hypothetical protein
LQQSRRIKGALHPNKVASAYQKKREQSTSRFFGDETRTAGCERERRKKREAERERGIAMDGYHISGSQEASSRA